jgi:hypothetical protein
MQNKNKRQFAENRLIYFGAEVPKLSEAEIAEVKKHKEEKGPELDTASLAAKANKRIEARTAALRELPPEFLQKMRGEIVRYINASPGRFEKDENKGLSAKEFSEFSSAMVSKVEELVKEYAPTEAEIAAKKEAQRAAEKASESAEKIKPVDIKEISEDPGQINDLDTLGARFNTYSQWNASVQQEASKALETGGAFQQAFAAFQKARNGVKAYEKMAAFFKGNDPKMQQLKSAQNKAFFAVNGSLGKINSVKAKLEKYGAKLAAVSNRLKQEKIKERDEKIKKIEEEENLTEEEKRARKERFAQLEGQQREFMAQRESFAKYGEEVIMKKYKAGDEKAQAETKKGQFAAYQENISKAIERVQTALQDPDITEEHKADLEATLAQLQQKSGEVSKGREVAGKVLEGKREEIRKWSDDEKALAQKSYMVEQHLQEHVGPAIALMDAQVIRLEDAKMQYATSKEQIMAHYENAFKKYDEIDAGVDDAVMKNNLANEKLSAALEAQKKSIQSINLESPGLYDATLGAAFSMAGGGVMMGGEWLIDQAKWLSSSLESARGEMGTFSYVAARIGVEILSTPIGVAGGIVEIGGGLLTMVGNPAQTATAMGSLIGRDPASGNWSWDNAGHAWTEMGKALIAYEDFSKGRIGVGVGKLFTNVVTTVTGAAAVSKGGQAAVAAAKAARAAGKGVIVTTGAAAKAGVTAGGRAALQVGREGFAKAGKAAAAVPGKLRAGGKAAAEGAKFVAREGVRKTARVAYEAGKRGVVAGIKVPKQLAAELAHTPGDYLAMRFEFIGKRFKGARERGLARQEAKIYEKVTKSAERYDEFAAEYNRIKKTNPELSDAQIRYQLSQENPTLYLEGVNFEKDMQRLHELHRSLSPKAKETHYYSEFVDDVPDELLAEGRTADGVPGYIDKEGKIKFVSSYFEKKYGVRLERRTVNGKPQNVFVYEGKAYTAKQFRKTEMGQVIFDEMKRVKEHESMHRIFELFENRTNSELSKSVMRFLSEDSPNANRIRAKLADRFPVLEEMTPRDLQEFLCEIADGRYGAIEGLASLEDVIAAQIPGFRFGKIRQMDTRLLATATPDELSRAFTDAMSIEEFNVQQLYLDEVKFAAIRGEPFDINTAFPNRLSERRIIIERMLQEGNPELLRATREAASEGARIIEERVVGKYNKLYLDAKRRGVPFDIDAHFPTGKRERAVLDRILKRKAEAEAAKAEAHLVEQAAVAFDEKIAQKQARVDKLRRDFTSALRQFEVDPRFTPKEKRIVQKLQETYLQAIARGEYELARLCRNLPLFQRHSTLFARLDELYPATRSLKVQQFVKQNHVEFSRVAKRSPAEIQKFVDEFNLTHHNLGPGPAREIVQLPDGKGFLAIDTNGHLRFLSAGEDASKLTAEAIKPFGAVPERELPKYGAQYLRAFEQAGKRLNLEPAVLGRKLSQLDTRDWRLLERNFRELNETQIMAILDRNFVPLDGDKIRLYQWKPDPVGTGGVAEVYLGFAHFEGSEHLQRVAIKRAYGSGIELGERRAALAREGQVADMIMKIMDENPGRFQRFQRPVYKGEDFIVYVDAGGKSGKYFDLLDACIDPEIRAKISDSEYWSAFADALDQLDEMHDFGLIHRDLKPENMAIGENGVQVSDLGSIRTFDEAANQRYIYITEDGRITYLDDGIAPENMDDYFREVGLDPEKIQVVPYTVGVTEGYYNWRVAYAASRGKIPRYREDYAALAESMDKAGFTGFHDMNGNPGKPRRFPPEHRAEARSLIEGLRTMDPNDPNYVRRLGHAARRIRSWYQ